ncbi:DUF6708 domain-containing protein [Psychrobacter sp. I-STPA6b]|uniref:DUF6708 domain-containing protein n=1 Tax=Psychrobacter sp. I-STPA6b TaxID=2585718 RepID=UPI001D0C4D19|nr:DUF6708 domain-containing protein [Psychrobacter sp. I-STPA6b]
MILPAPQQLPVGKIIGRSYEGEIANFKEKEHSINRLSALTHEINPDYLLFHPSITSFQLVCFLASYCSAWLFGQNLFIFLVIFYKITFNEGIDYLYFLALLVWFILVILLGFAPYKTLKQLKVKHSRYYKILLLKSTQQIAYYEHKRKQAPIFHIINYKDIIASVRGSEGTQLQSLNLHIIDKTTNELIHSIMFNDDKLNPYDQWAFIRTYMERPANELPLNPEYTQACPTDMSQSLFACADIAQISKGLGYTTATHAVHLTGWLRTCLVGYLDLAEGNIYQSSKNPALHPDIKNKLQWNGENNPYNIIPVTPERQLAFANQNQSVKNRWYTGIAINLIWFIGSILYVMLVIA